jgi:hypothetical protein
MVVIEKNDLFSSSLPAQGYRGSNSGISVGPDEVSEAERGRYQALPRLASLDHKKASVENTPRLAMIR